MYVCGGVCVHVCVGGIVHACVHVCGRHGSSLFACFVMWLMVTPPVLGCALETRQSQGPLRWTCNPTMGLHFTYTSYCAEEDAYTQMEFSHHGNAAKHISQ